MLTLAGIDSAIDRSSIEVETIHAFLRRTFKAFGIEFLDAEYLQHYDELKQTLIEYLNTELITAADIAEQRRVGANNLCWDKLLIDEGQDWPDDERHILFRLFESRNLIVACGSGQLVRSNCYADWTKGVEVHKPIIYEKRSLRQKRNLTDFQRAYADHFGIPWDLEPSDNLVGGNVIINIGGIDADLLLRLDAKCKQDGNQAYDFLFLSPPSLTVAEGESRRFALHEQFENCGIRVWDGIPRDNRTDFPTDIKEHRVVTYESARGLEGWVIACLDLDSFYDYKLRYPYVIPDSELGPSGPGLTNRDEELTRIVHEWVLIAFSRAIDTLVINLRDANHSFSRQLLTLASGRPDFVEVIYTPIGIQGSQA